MKEIEEALKRFRAIADKNDDEFRFFIRIMPTPAGITYLFEVEETADRHEFISGAGITIEDAVADALDCIPEACKDWGYES